MKICSYSIVEEMDFFFPLVGYNYILILRELLSWMCANLDLLATKANNEKLNVLNLDFPVCVIFVLYQHGE